MESDLTNIIEEFTNQPENIDNGRYVRTRVHNIIKCHFPEPKGITRETKSEIAIWSVVTMFKKTFTVYVLSQKAIGLILFTCRLVSEKLLIN